MLGVDQAGNVDIVASSSKKRLRPEMSLAAAGWGCHKMRLEYAPNRVQIRRGSRLDDLDGFGDGCPGFSAPPGEKSSQREGKSGVDQYRSA